MKKIFLAIIIAYLLWSCKTNNYIKYHRYINEAEYSFYNQDYESANRLYGKAFQKVPIPFEDDMFYYAASLWQTGNTSASIAMLDTLYGIEWILMKSGYFEGMDSLVREKLIRKNMEKVTLIHARRDSHPLLAVFDSITKRDQCPRKEFDAVYPTIADDPVKLQLAWQKVLKADSLNLLVVDSLIKEHGFIGGVFFPANPRIMHLMMLHQLNWVYENPRLFKKAIKQGRLVPVDYATAYDKFLLNCLEDTVVYYGQFSKKLDGVSPEDVFKRSCKLGISPYFLKWVRLPRQKGRQPEKHPYYNYYEARKDYFRCY